LRNNGPGPTPETKRIVSRAYVTDPGHIDGIEIDLSRATKVVSKNLFVKLDRGLRN
jgi:hypothetical protein